MSAIKKNLNYREGYSLISRKGDINPIIEIKTTSDRVADTGTIIIDPDDSDYSFISDDQTKEINFSNTTKFNNLSYNFFNKLTNITHVRIYPIVSNTKTISFNAAIIPDNYDIIGTINSKNSLKNKFNKDDIISTNIIDTILPSPSNITYYNHIHDTHSHIDINTDKFNDEDIEPFKNPIIKTHLHDYHDHKPTNMIAFVEIILYHSNGNFSFIRQFDNISTSNIVDFKHLNRYFKINKIIIKVNTFNKHNCVNCKLNIKQLNAFTISNIDDFHLGFVDDKSTKLNVFDTININNPNTNSIFIFLFI